MAKPLTKRFMFSPPSYTTSFYHLYTTRAIVT
jgi:hypothetical protein